MLSCGRLPVLGNGPSSPQSCGPCEHFPGDRAGQQAWQILEELALFPSACSSCCRSRCWLHLPSETAFSPGARTRGEVASLAGQGTLDLCLAWFDLLKVVSAGQPQSVRLVTTLGVGQSILSLIEGC